MKSAVFALAAAAGFSAFAQSQPMPPSGASPATPHLLSGGTTIEQSRNTTTAMGAGGATTQTVVTKYWVNVPANAERRADFQRWQQLK